MKELFAPKEGLFLWIYIFGALAVGAFVLFCLTKVPKKARKPMVAAITFDAGLFLSLEFLIPHDNVFTETMPAVSNWQLIISCFTLFMGLGSLFYLHGRRVAERGENTLNSLGFFVGFFAIIIFGILSDMNIKGTQALFDVFFSGIYVSMAAAMFSLVAFYIVSASYRAFRIRNAETALLFLSTAVIMLALIPLGTAITSFIPEHSIFAPLKLENLGYWILTSPNMAVQRAIAFGIGVGAMATSLRIWLSLEKGNFYDKEL